jgi:hypothetical protein
MTDSRRAPGWREVLGIAAITVAVVLGADVLTSLLPPDARGVITNTPLLIGVLVIGTALVLWRIAARRPPPP